MKFDCVSSKMANENQFTILKEHQEAPIHTWSRGQDAVPRILEKANSVLVHNWALLRRKIRILALDITRVFKAPENLISSMVDFSKNPLK